MYITVQIITVQPVLCVDAAQKLDFLKGPGQSPLFDLSATSAKQRARECNDTLMC